MPGLLLRSPKCIENMSRMTCKLFMSGYGRMFARRQFDFPVLQAARHDEMSMRDGALTVCVVILTPACH